MDYDLNVTQLTTGLGGLLTDEMTSFTEDMVGADSPLHTTPPSFGFKPNMTVRKFFNVSIPMYHNHIFLNKLIIIVAKNKT